MAKRLPEPWLYEEEILILLLAINDVQGVTDEQSAARRYAKANRYSLDRLYAKLFYSRIRAEKGTPDPGDADDGKKVISGQ